MKQLWNVGGCTGFSLSFSHTQTHAHTQIKHSNTRTLIYSLTQTYTHTLKSLQYIHHKHQVQSSSNDNNNLPKHAQISNFPKPGAWERKENTKQTNRVWCNRVCRAALSHQVRIVFNQWHFSSLFSPSWTRECNGGNQPEALQCKPHEALQSAHVTTWGQPCLGFTARTPCATPHHVRTWTIPKAVLVWPFLALGS